MPADTVFRTRPEQVIEMIEVARAADVPFAWFTADEEFGQNPGLREYLEGAGVSYVMAVPKNTNFTDSSGEQAQLAALAATLKPNAWHRRKRIPRLRLDADRNREPCAPVYDSPVDR